MREREREQNIQKERKRGKKGGKPERDDDTMRERESGVVNVQVASQLRFHFWSPV